MGKKKKELGFDSDGAKKSCEKETIWQICQGSGHLDLWQM